MIFVKVRVYTYIWSGKWIKRTLQVEQSSCDPTLTWESNAQAKSVPLHTRHLIKPNRSTRHFSRWWGSSTSDKLWILVFRRLGKTEVLSYQINVTQHCIIDISSYLIVLAKFGDDWIMIMEDIHNVNLWMESGDLRTSLHLNLAIHKIDKLDFFSKNSQQHLALMNHIWRTRPGSWVVPRVAVGPVFFFNFQVRI